MKYNSQRDLLRIREYGRHIQNLLIHCRTLETKEKRTKFAHQIIELMSQLNPHLKTVHDYKHKLWDHLFYMANFDLDVDSPYEIPTSEADIIPPPQKRLDYPKSSLRFKHYGKNVETMIKKAVEMEDKDKQKAFAEVIGNYMKMVYKNWNRESVNDDQILSDLKMLSDEKLDLGADSNLDSLHHSNRRKRSNKPGPDNKTYRKKPGGPVNRRRRY